MKLDMFQCCCVLTVRMYLLLVDNKTTMENESLDIFILPGEDDANNLVIQFVVQPLAQGANNEMMEVQDPGTEVLLNLVFTIEQQPIQHQPDHFDSQEMLLILEVLLTDLLQSLQSQQLRCCRRCSCLQATREVIGEVWADMLRFLNLNTD